MSDLSRTKLGANLEHHILLITLVPKLAERVYGLNASSLRKCNEYSILYYLLQLFVS